MGYLFVFFLLFFPNKNIATNKDFKDILNKEIKREDIDNTIIKNRIKKNSKNQINDKISYSVGGSGEIKTKEKIVLLNGDVNIKSESRDISLDADNAKINFEKNVIEAYGRKDKKYNFCNPRVKVKINKNKTLFADSIKYNFSSNRGLANNVLFVLNKYIIRVQEAKIDYDESVYGKNVFFTTCKRSLPSWGFFFDKAIYSKDFIIGKGVKIMFLGRIINFPLPFIYKFPKQKQSGFVYPTGVWFNLNQGFYADPGFYLYFNECADILFRLKIYTDGTLNLNITHRYIKKDHYSGVINFLYCIYPEKLFKYYLYGEKKNFKQQIVFNINHNYNVKYYKNYTSIYIYKDEYKINNQKQNIKISSCHSIKNIPFLNDINISQNYSKDFKTGIEDLIIADVNTSKSINIFNFLSITTLFNFKSKSSNQKIDYEIKDPNDVDFKDDDEDDENYNRFVFFEKKEFKKKEINEEAFKSENFNSYFTKKYWNNIYKNINSGAQIKIPINIKFNILKWINSYFSINYCLKLYKSKLKKKEEKYVPTDLDGKKLYLIHETNENININIFKNDLTIFSFKKQNFFNLKEISWSFSIPFSFSFSPSSEFMHGDNNIIKFIKKIPFLVIENPYDENEKINVFSHSVFGNVNHYVSGIINVGINNYLCLKNNDKKGYKTKIFSFYINGGYDFLADNKNTFKWQNINFKCDFDLWFFKISYNTLINLYKYIQDDDVAKTENNIITNNILNNINNIEENDINNNEGNIKYKKIGEIEIDNSSKFFFDKKNFLSHNINVFLSIFNSHKNDKKYITNEYQGIFVLENLSFNIDYNFNYVFNPVKNKTQIIQTYGINCNTKLSKKWIIFSNLNFKKTDNNEFRFLNSSLGLQRDLCDCWTISIHIDYNIDKTFDKNNFSYVVSLTPKDSTLNALSQTRRDNLEIK